MDEKTCIKCGEIYPNSLDYFPMHRLRNKKKTTRNVCKFCRSDYMREYRYKQPEFLRNASLSDEQKVFVVKDPDPCAGFFHGATFRICEVTKMLTLNNFTPDTIISIQGVRYKVVMGPKRQELIRHAGKA